MNSFSQSSMNLDFEVRDYLNTSLPELWITRGEGFKISLDSIEKHTGKYSLKMENPDNPNNKFGTFMANLPIEPFAGKNIEYRGWIKTKDVKTGYAGLLFRVDSADVKGLGYDYMNDRGLKGDNDWTQASIKMDVSKDGTRINFGGLFTGEGTVWFDNLELYVNGEKYIDIIEPEPKKTLSKEEIASLKKYIYPLRTYEPDGGDTKDLKVLDKLIGNSKVVALGENSHGSSEIFKMKNRIIQYLAENKCFNIFSMEADMPEAYRLNDYTIRGEGDPEKLIRDMNLLVWSTEEVLNMVEWMHKYNQPKQRIEFTGFDMQDYRGAVNELISSFIGNEAVESKINILKKKLEETRAPTQQNSSGIINNRGEIDTILLSLQNNIDTSSFQIPQKAWLQQNIVIIKQYLGDGDADYNIFSWRDKCMADNFMWIKEQNPNSKLIIWAHNGHIMKTNTSMGSSLAQKLGDNYTTFGFTFFDGSYLASGSKGLTSYKATTAYPGTLEYLLNQLNEPIFILDLKKIKSDNNKDMKWLMEQLKYRFVGATVLEDMNDFMNRKICDDFDYLIFIKTSSSSILFPYLR